ncbi:CRISPR-associated helicase/endonuclease Cas3 [Sediminispirochaeta bajacaliforniensis]|uniref:CRISPR-associated helicase/endonuclease Cas3 n=1 Tax=Sediminispirochaeta bajacaliforniensis TaxID=148 RepID=UPI0003664E58|nr:CRISPR-associated helicase/endonuclease Cas3 [Sediminispirochaeta bajacaliforniensis]
MNYIAHTPPSEKPELQPHLYSSHIKEMVEYGCPLLKYLLSFSEIDGEQKKILLQTFKAALMLHDMGKLDEENQSVLRGERKGRLPVDHLDAGVAIADSMQNELAAWIIRGHHSPGLSSKKSEKYFIRQLTAETGMKLSTTSLRGLRHKRLANGNSLVKEDFLRHFDAIKKTDSNINNYIARQKECCGVWPDVSMRLPESGLTTRLILSCLVDADHGSAGAYSLGTSLQPFVPLNTLWNKRLSALDKYIRSLRKDVTGLEKERNELRELFYQHCYTDELLKSKLAMCSAPVGLGKTTSVMAYLLRKSIENNASRIIVIAPFSNIIDQTVKVLRKAIVLEGEEPEQIVVAHHHKADFSDKDMRQYTVLWRAPIVVTTAVQFFETLASANPTKLRKLQAVVGASIFIDESHACLPAWLLKISWHWLRELSNSWGCNIVFSSGSMVEFWNDRYLIGEEEVQQLPDLFSKNLQKKAMVAETKRVEFREFEDALSLNDIIDKIQDIQLWNGLHKQIRPSCLIIMNTVQSAAVVAYSLASVLNDMGNSLQNKQVLHLSTALAPKDRDIILKEIQRRQEDSEWNQSRWYLIATSCVEAGVDLDFSIGFRERCSVTSFLQVAGRINRHGLRSSGLLYDFSIVPENGLNKHPGFEDASIVFLELWSDIIRPEISLAELSTTAIRKEYSRINEKDKEGSDNIFFEEKKLDFQEVEREYHIIKTDTATVIIDADVVQKLELGIPVSWQNIQESSVQLWSNKIQKWHLHPVARCKNDDIFSWTDTYEYDSSFLGIMGGILKIDKFFKNEGGII